MAATLCSALPLGRVVGLPARAEQPQVQLLFPVLTGLELERLMRLAPQAMLSQINGQTYVLIGRFDDARVAHRLGRTLQARFGLPFDLAYDAGHPQLDLAWLRDGTPDLAAAPSTGNRPSKATPMPNAPSLLAEAPGRLSAGALQTGPDQQLSLPLQASSQQEALPVAPAHRGMPARAEGSDSQASPAGAAALMDPGLSVITLSAVFGSRPLFGSQGPLQERLAASVPASVPATTEQVAAPPQPPAPAPSPVGVLAAPFPEPTASVQPAASSEPPPQELAAASTAASPVQEDLPTVNQVASVSTPVTLPPVPRLIQSLGPVPVPVRASRISALPVTRLAPAPNLQLDYLFVRITDAQQLATLQRIVPVAELAQEEGRLLARVGVYTRSRRGQLLLEQRLEQLRPHRLKLLVARGGSPQPVSA